MPLANASKLVLHAPAKLNLFLNILGKRADGFHDIETIMQKISLYDSLQFTPHKSKLNLKIASVDGTADIPLDERNLVIKAASLLRNRAGIDLGAQISLVKRIPAQAGLGGGSSDAATTLVGLNQLWNLGYDRNSLAGLGAQIGSDIPFFVHRYSTALGTGRGEIITPVVGRPLHFVVIKPRTGLSTAKVYTSHPLSPSSQTAKEFLNFLHHSPTECIKSGLYNSLQSAAILLNQELTETLERISRLDFAGTMMSGSGTACFGICRNQAHAKALGRKLTSMNLGQVFTVQGFS